MTTSKSLANVGSRLGSLLSLRNADLQALSAACGLVGFGPKAVLAARLEAAATDNPLMHLPKNCDRGRNERSSGTGMNTSSRGNSRDSSSSSPRILSIDLGIRNLATILLTPRDASHVTRNDNSPASATAAAAGLISSAAPEPYPVVLHSWRHLNLVPDPGPDPSPDSGETGRKKPAGNNDAWTPAAMATLACRLVTTQILPGQPTHVLIERQRFRTNSAGPVQEWTLRVNTLEGMIFAILQMMRERGDWMGVVHSVTPGRVGTFWVHPNSLDLAAEEKEPGKRRRKKKKKKLDKEDEEREVDAEALEEQDIVNEDIDRSGPLDLGEMGGTKKKRPTKGRAARMKRVKVDLVGEWLAQSRASKGGAIEFQGEAALAARSYLEQWASSNKRLRSKKKDKAEAVEDKGSFTKLLQFPKLDDMADSLLQGMAWLKWEENRKILASADGVDELLLRIGRGRIGGETKGKKSEKKEKVKKQGSERKKKDEGEGEARTKAEGYGLNAKARKQKAEYSTAELDAELQKGADTPIPRRGRPPKIETLKTPIQRIHDHPPMAEVVEIPIPKRRGRPPKSQVVEPPIRRGRGRPPKIEVVELPIRRGRGRPRKTV